MSVTLYGRPGTLDVIGSVTVSGHCRAGYGQGTRTLRVVPSE